MLIFITENTGEWTGIYYAVDSERLVDVPEPGDPEFLWRGVEGAGHEVLMSRWHPRATYAECSVPGIVACMRRAVTDFEKGGRGVQLDEYGNIYIASLGDKPWAEYRVFVDIESNEG